MPKTILAKHVQQAERNPGSDSYLSSKIQKEFTHIVRSSEKTNTTQCYLSQNTVDNHSLNLEVHSIKQDQVVVIFFLKMKTKYS